MHVGWATVFDPPEEGPRPGFEELRDHVVRRLPRAPRYRQMLQPVPLGVNTPVWVDDHRFDVARHVVPARSRSPRRDRLAVHVRAASPRPPPVAALRRRPRSPTGASASSARRTTAWSTGSPPSSSPSLLLDPDARAAAVRSRTSGSPRPARRPVISLAVGVADAARGAAASWPRCPARIARSPAAAASSSRPRRARRRARSPARLDRRRRPGALNHPISPPRRLGLLSTAASTTCTEIKERFRHEAQRRHARRLRRRRCASFLQRPRRDPDRR